MLSIAIRTNEDIEVITTLGRRIKLAQYADDMNIFLSNEDCAHALLDYLNSLKSDLV